MSDATLGKSLSTTLMGITDLILDETSETKKTKLRALHARISKQLKTLIDKTVPADTLEYVKATEALEKANAAIEDAKEDLKSVAKAISKVATALTWVEKVASAVA